MESYLHKQAKELLFSQIKELKKLSTKNGYVETVRWKDDVYMEYPSVYPEGNYSDECACKSVSGCVYSKDQHEMRFAPDNSGHWIDRYSLKNNPGYCKCSSCKYLEKAVVVIHDIVAISTGNVHWAVEIINKHPPTWQNKINLNYPVYIVRAENILKRVSNTPVFVDDVL